MGLSEGGVAALGAAFTLTIFRGGVRRVGRVGDGEACGRVVLYANSTSTSLRWCAEPS